MERLHKLVQAVCPIHGLQGDSIQDLVVDFKDEATQPERDAANALVASWTQDDYDTPLSVRRAQFKKAVLNSGQLANVKAQYANLSDEAKIYWDDAEWVEIDSVLITELQALLGFNDQQVKTFFKNAKDL